MPGFRKGKVPAALVIQRVGREGGARGGAPRRAARVVRARAARHRRQPGRRPEARRPGDARRRASRCASRSRSASARRPQLGDYKGLEVGRAEAEAPPEAVDAELERLREGFARLKPVERDGAEGDVLLIDFEGTFDGEAFEGGEARDYLLELGTESLLEGFEKRSPARGRARSARSSVTLSRRLPARAARRQGRHLRGQGQGGAREGAARARRRVRLRAPPSSTRSTSCATTSPTRSARRSSARSSRSSARRRSTPRSRRRTVDVPDEVVTARADRDVGARRALAAGSRDRTRAATCRCRTARATR